METHSPARLDSDEVNLGKPIDAAEFVELVRDPLQRHDTDALVGLIQDRWSCEQMISLLTSGESDVRKLAALALGVAGDRHCITALAGCLRDSDPMVNQMAEHALWTVWFRCGNKEAQELVQRGTSLLNDKRWSEALADFTEATRRDPTYAEARNQLAITHYLLEDFHSSIDDGQVVVQLMPTHFGAWAGLGHCYAHLGDIRRAKRCYRHALGINPYLQCVRQILAEISSGQCDSGIGQADVTP